MTLRASATASGRRRLPFVAAMVAGALSLTLTGLGSAGTATASASTISTTCPWVTSKASTAKRVTMLLNRMSVAQIDVLVSGIPIPDEVGSDKDYSTIMPGISALCIPRVTFANGPEGIDGSGNTMSNVTQLPAAVSASASWSTSELSTWGKLIGNEAVKKGVNVVYGPTVNIVRDPRWGRAFETLGEDPYLSGQLAASEIKGIQSQGVMSEVKHYAVYNEETNRNTPEDDAIVSKRTMQEIYLPAFRDAVQQGGAASVMCSYATVNGVDACENPYLYQVLEKQFGFAGFVGSDRNATHDTVAAANAGLDFELPTDYFGDPLVSAVDGGQVAVATVQEMARRILTEMFRFDMFNKATTGTATAVATSPAHASTARNAAERGSVLLKNRSTLLPLSKKKEKSLAVIGSDASTNVISTGGGSASVVAPYVISPLSGITSRAGRSTKVSYAIGDDAVTDQPVVPASAFPSGLQATYYNSTKLSGTQAAATTVGNVDFDWPQGSPSYPSSVVNATGWSASFTGEIEAPTTDTYKFTLDSSYDNGALENGARLSINGKVVINDWSGTSSTPGTAWVNLTAGQPVNIEVDFQQSGDSSATTDFGLHLGWVSQSDLITQAASVARSAKVAIVFAAKSEGEGTDLSGISLSARENDLINAVASANKHTIVVLNTGSAVTMPWLSRVQAVIEAWYPGEQDGNAIAALLYGSANFSGHLPVTFPRSLANVPAASAARWPGVNGQVDYSEGLLVGYRWYTTKHITPLYPFGYGLSYTTFRLSNLRVIPKPKPAKRKHKQKLAVAAGKQKVQATVTVTNTGKRAGWETVQLYVHDPRSTGEPTRQLVGFRTVHLQPHHHANVTIPLNFYSFAHYSSAKSKWLVSAGNYQLLIGSSSTTLPLSRTLEVRRSWH
jgi:beta-glucosidase